MANPEHLRILRQGVDAWNAWRKNHIKVVPNLSYANLFKADLNGANLLGANLTGAVLSGANLSRANLNEASLSRASLSSASLDRAGLSHASFASAILTNAILTNAILINANFSYATLHYTNLSHAVLTNAILTGANFSYAILAGADLNHAILAGADLSRATLTNAILTNAILTGANFSYAILTGADLNHAIIGWTTFGSLDLRMVKGLETLGHEGPSSVGTDTVLRSEGDIPESFLRRAGLNDTFINYILALAKKPIQYYTCFISYSSEDQEFANRLYADLQANNVRCWYAPEDLKIGDKFRIRIDESIRLYDKLLLVLSEDSLASNWVAYEVEKALNKEPEGIPNVLFPIRLDGTILTCETDWAKDIRRSRHIGDFEHWKDHDAYQQAFQRLLRDLKAQS